MLWDFGNESYSNEENPQYQYENNTYGYLATLVASTVQGCSDTASLFIECKEAPIIFIPNSFTPDEDQYNQVFTPVISPSIDPYNYTYGYTIAGAKSYLNHINQITDGMGAMELEE